MSSTASHKIFNFIALPGELREKIYQYSFAPIPSNAVELLLRRGPNAPLRATCRLIYQESTKAYDYAYTNFSRTRAVLLESIAEEGRYAARFMPLFSPRKQALMRAITLLTRGALPRHQGLQCGHFCDKFDAYSCSCLEHETCFNCGKWLALAVYYDLHPEARIPALTSTRGRISIAQTDTPRPNDQQAYKKDSVRILLCALRGQH